MQQTVSSMTILHLIITIITTLLFSQLTQLDQQHVNGQLTPTATSYKTIADAGNNYALVWPAGVRVSNYSRVLIADTGNHQLKFIHSNGSLLTLCGTGEKGFAESPLVGGKFKARYSKLNEPRQITMSTTENALYIAESGNNIIRKLNLMTGQLVIVAGNLTAGFSGDGKIATQAMLNGPRGVTFDTTTQKYLYISDTLNHIVRKLDIFTGIITTIAGTAGSSGFTDNVLATSAKLNGPQAVAIMSNGDIYIADTQNNRIRKITAATGIISTICGTGNGGIAGDGSAATSAMINSPRDLFLGLQNDLYIADSWNHRLRRIDLRTGIIQTVSGTTIMSGPESVSINILSKPGVSSMAITVTDTNNQRILMMEYSCNSTNYSINSNGTLCVTKPLNLTIPDWRETDIGDYWMNEEEPVVECQENYFGQYCEYKYCYGKIVAANSTCLNTSLVNGYVEKLTVVKDVTELDSKSVSFDGFKTSFEFPATMSDQINNVSEIVLVSSIYDPSTNSAPVLFSNSDKLKSTVMSISLYDRQSAQEIAIKGLQDPISLAFFNVSIGKSEHLNYSCAYYNTLKNTWESSGLKTTILSFLNKTIDNTNFQVVISVKCETSHLTSFGVIDISVKKTLSENKVQTSTYTSSDQSAVTIGITVGVVGVVVILLIILIIVIFTTVLLLRSKRKNAENRKKLQAKLQDQLKVSSPSTSSSV